MRIFYDAFIDCIFNLSKARLSTVYPKRNVSTEFNKGIESLPQNQLF